MTIRRTTIPRPARRSGLVLSILLLGGTTACSSLPSDDAGDKQQATSYTQVGEVIPHGGVQLMAAVKTASETALNLDPYFIEAKESDGEDTPRCWIRPFDIGNVQGEGDITDPGNQGNAESEQPAAAVNQRNSSAPVLIRSRHEEEGNDGACKTHTGVRAARTETGVDVESGAAISYTSGTLATQVLEPGEGGVNSDRAVVALVVLVDGGKETWPVAVSEFGRNPKERVLTDANFEPVFESEQIKPLSTEELQPLGRNASQVARLNSETPTGIAIDNFCEGWHAIAETAQSTSGNESEDGASKATAGNQESRGDSDAETSTTKATGKIVLVYGGSDPTTCKIDDVQDIPKLAKRDNTPTASAEDNNPVDTDDKNTNGASNGNRASSGGCGFDGNYANCGALAPNP